MKTKKIIKKLKLRKEIKTLICGIIFLVLFAHIVLYAMDRYNSYLIDCDMQKGYTCNIFGR